MGKAEERLLKIFCLYKPHAKNTDRNGLLDMISRGQKHLLIYILTFTCFYCAACGGQFIVPENDSENKKQINIHEEGKPLVLFDELKEISKEQFVQLHGKKKLMEHPITAVAERLGKVDIKAEYFKPDILKPGVRLSILTFEKRNYIIKVNKVTDHGEVTSIAGKVEGEESGYMFLSVSENKALGTFELPAKNIIYLLKFDQQEAEHYLFEAPLDQVERLPD